MWRTLSWSGWCAESCIKCKFFSRAYEDRRVKWAESMCIMYRARKCYVLWDIASDGLWVIKVGGDWSCCVKEERWWRAEGKGGIYTQELYRSLRCWFLLFSVSGPDFAIAGLLLFLQFQVETALYAVIWYCGLLFNAAVALYVVDIKWKASNYIDFYLMTRYTCYILS